MLLPILVPPSHVIILFIDKIISSFYASNIIYFKSKYFLMLAGVEHVGGDMFETVPKADAIFMKVSGCF